MKKKILDLTSINIFIWLFISSIFQGCTTVRLYPICQYQGAVDENTKSAFEASARTLFHSFSIENNDIGVMNNFRYITVNASECQHEKIAQIWSYLGCVGNYSNSLDRAKYASCLKYINVALDQDTPGIPENEALCFFQKNCPERTGQEVDALIYCNGSGGAD